MKLGFDSITLSKFDAHKEEKEWIWFFRSDTPTLSAFRGMEKAMVPLVNMYFTVKSKHFE